MTPHGTRNDYARGCRCTLCTEANRVHSLKKYYERKARMAAGYTDFKHGLSGYTAWSCRCDVCRQAYSDAVWRRRAGR